MDLLSARQQRMVLDTVDQRLSRRPFTLSRNLTRMRPNAIAPWVLRVGNLRVYFDVVDEPEPSVFVRAVGIKEHNLVRIGKERFEL
jgi:hypothetical protein